MHNQSFDELPKKGLKLRNLIHFFNAQIKKMGTHASSHKKSAKEKAMYENEMKQLDKRLTSLEIKYADSLTKTTTLVGKYK